MSNRQSIPSSIETLVLMQSARRCALCFGFEGNLKRQKGQIAHIDHDASNAKEENLVYLCLEHHDEYDSKTSQVKGITEVELSAYKERLVGAISRDEHINAGSNTPPSQSKAEAIRGHDLRLFTKGDELLPEKRLMLFLDNLQTDDSYFISNARQIDTFRSFFSETGNQFIDQETAKLLAGLLTSLDALLIFIYKHFFVYPDRQDYKDDLRLCMYPELNIDRNGTGSPESMTKYNSFQESLNKVVTDTSRSYTTYRAAIKQYLFV